MPQPLSPNTPLNNNRYSVSHVLDTDGISIFYKATDRALDCEVTIRELYLERWNRDGLKVKPDDNDHAQALMEHFRHQACLLAKARRSLGLQARSYLVNVFDCFTDPNTETIYLVMEPIKYTLRTFLEKRQRSESLEREIRGYISDIALGLAELHSKKYLHRMITPNSIWIIESESDKPIAPEPSVTRGEADSGTRQLSRPVLVDFWLAESMPADGSPASQQSEQNAGVNDTYAEIEKPDLAGSFAAPEQLGMITGAVSYPTDIYGLAATYYCLLTGEPPERDNDSFDPAAKLAEFGSQIGNTLRSALSKQPGDRPTSLMGFIRKLNDDPDTTQAATSVPKEQEISFAMPTWLLPRPWHQRGFHTSYALVGGLLILLALWFQVMTPSTSGDGPTPDPTSTPAPDVTVVRTTTPRVICCTATVIVGTGTVSPVDTPMVTATTPSVSPSPASPPPTEEPSASPFPTPIPTSIATVVASRTPSVTTSNTPTPTPTLVGRFAHVEFRNLWKRTDSLVTKGLARPYFWGSEPSWACYEPYMGRLRLVQYFQKSRMELNNPDKPFVTNGLLTVEMITGKIQTGDNADVNFEKRSPAAIAVVGDSPNDPDAPTYAALLGQFRRPELNDLKGEYVTARLDHDGKEDDSDTSTRINNIHFSHYVTETQHNVPDVFWDFLNKVDVVEMPDGQRAMEQLMTPWHSAMGYPITEPFWIRATINRSKYDYIMIQAYQRRILTYVPGANGWERVQMNNIGDHYYSWRYPNGNCLEQLPPQP